MNIPIETTMDRTTPTRQSSMLPYIAAGVILVLIGAIFILILLFLRPKLDELILISTVAGIGGTMFASISALIKSQETHLTVNSQLTSWKNEFFEMAHAKGVIAGTETEQARVAEALRLKVASESVVLAPPTTVISSTAPAKLGQQAGNM
jgi:DMSO reductase anchor subunit